ncbi:transglycosylase domain-containing protein [bacterium]|nr:transglycosylase domain-containing protein [bacterium]
MTYDDIPPFLLDTIIGMEDQRFWSHP